MREIKGTRVREGGSLRVIQICGDYDRYKLQKEAIKTWI